MHDNVRGATNNMSQPREKRFFLGAVRIVCMTLLVASLAVVVIDIAEIAGGTHVPTAHVNPAVEATEVLAKIPGTETANDLLSDAPDSGLKVPNAEGLVIPQALKSALLADDDSQPVLNAWLGNVPTTERQGFLNELSVVVALAMQHAQSWEWDNRQRYVAAAMTEYARMKIDRLNEAQDEQARAAARDERYLVSAGVLVVLIGMLTLLLILLAIERNTRPDAARGAREPAGHGTAAR
jgi:hypothetical protein